MATASHTIAKELSWLSFNARVLQEAMDPEVPLIERLRFLGIFSNNLDEFFRVRVADVKRRILIESENAEGNDAEQLMKEIQLEVLDLQQQFERTYQAIVQQLAAQNIVILDESQLSELQGHWVQQYFYDHVLPVLSPVLLSDDKEFPPLEDQSIYLAIKLTLADDRSEYSLLEIPTERVGRFIAIPQFGKKRPTLHTFILLENIIRFCLKQVYAAVLDVTEATAYTIKVTRDAELELEDGISQSLLDQLSSSIKARLHAAPVRFVYDKEMPAEMTHFFIRKLKLLSYDSMIPGARHHNFKDFINFPAVGRRQLVRQPEAPLHSSEFDVHRNAFDAIRSRDILLYYPYHSFRHFTDWLNQAAVDPRVRSIHISLYRVARQSRVVNALICAARNGKQVTATVELRARFDEAANIEWAKTMTEAGVSVEFGVPTLKVHTKLCLIHREEAGRVLRYAHIGTGNFHEGTAKVYTDFSLFTTHPDITLEVEQVFEFLARPYRAQQFRHLVVSPLNTRSRWVRLVQREMEHAQAGRAARIILKVNNLVDDATTELLYQASQAGVRIEMIVRGMCSLTPGLPGISENISAISIVDQYLEHPRVFVFHNDGDSEVYISSADLMTRNLDHRVEVGCPVYDPALKQTIVDILELQLTDNVKARVLDATLENHYQRRGRRRNRSQRSIRRYLAEQTKGVSQPTG